MKFVSTVLLSLAFIAACGPKSPPPVQAPFSGTMPDPTDVHIVGDHITIDDHLNFETDSDVILASSDELLDHIAQALANHPEITHLQIIGHTDAAGGHEHNQDLSERRAASVVRALQARGVTARLDAAGVGELEHLCQEDTDECHATNRRVEFRIVQ